MTQENADAVVTAILNDFMLGATLPIHEGLFNFERAVNALRISAFKRTTPISQEQRRLLDDAIRTAQPCIVFADPAWAADLRVMVCALHFVTAEWAIPARQDVAQMPNIAIEAFALARVLDNHLNTTNILGGLRRNRATLDEAQLFQMRDAVNALYPLPEASPEPMPFYATGSVN